jgi:hypothetical protein
LHIANCLLVLARADIKRTGRRISMAIWVVLPPCAWSAF